MESQAILMITDLIVSCGLPTAIRRLQTLDADHVSLESLAALKPCRSLADPDCHFSLDDSAFSDEGASCWTGR